MSKQEMLDNSRNLDKVLKESNARMIKLNSDNQEEINKTIYYNLECIRNSILDLIVNYNEGIAKKNKYNKEYGYLIKCWDKFTSENVSPKEAGIRLEKVRTANLVLMSVLENRTPDDHLRIIK